MINKLYQVNRKAISAMTNQTFGMKVREMETVTTNLPIQAREKLRNIAFAERSSVSEVARQILMEGLSKRLEVGIAV
jgi:uncharacterized membrane protein